MPCNIPIDQDTVLANCPADTELLLFLNVQGQPTLTALRTWAQIKICIGVKPPIAGSVGARVGLPVAGESVYQDDRIIGMGSTNDGDISFMLAGTPYLNFGNNVSFDYDPDTGTITLLNGNTFKDNDDFTINTNQ